MKPFLIILLFSLPVTAAFAQQTSQVDDALLLDYYQTHKFIEASVYLANAYPEPVTDVKVLSRMAYVSEMAGKLTDAENYYQRIYDKDSTNTAVLYNMAVINQRRGNINKAETYYKKIILKDTTDFQVYKQLATISHNKANIVAEIVYLQKANTLNPFEFNVASDLSDIYVSLKQLEQAETVLNKAISNDPQNTILMQSLLTLTYAQKKWPQVIKTGEQLLQLGDRSQSLKLGIAYYNLKSYLCGLETLLAIPQEIQNESTSYFIAACYKQLKDQQKAIFYLKKAIVFSLSKGTATYYNEMADSYQQIDQLKSAENNFKKGLLYDQKPMAYYAMATLYDTKLKNKANALLYYKKYLNSKPKEEDKDQINYSKSRVTALSGH